MTAIAKEGSISDKYKCLCCKIASERLGCSSTAAVDIALHWVCTNVISQFVLQNSQILCMALSFRVTCHGSSPQEDHRLFFTVSLRRVVAEAGRLSVLLAAPSVNAGMLPAVEKTCWAGSTRPTD